MPVFTDPAQLVVVANIAYPLALVAFGAALCHGWVRRASYREGYDDGEAMGRKETSQATELDSNHAE